MKYSFNWLKELSDTKLSIEKVADALTMHSLEIEEIEKAGDNLKGIIVGKILKIRKHPKADKLQLVRVDVGKNSPAGELDIVCGASNIKIGDKVPVALVGTVLPSGMKIKEASIRDEKSFGMLCAEDELGLGKDHSGIMILSKEAVVGSPANKYLGSEDEVIEIKVLPDRAHDAMSHVGVAREITTLENRELDYDFEGLNLPKIKSKKLKVEIKDKYLCPRYIGAVLENVTVKESPQWMKGRLQSCGVRSINNVVDATNYIMLELGNPLHAFDAKKLKTMTKNEKFNIVVRRARANEKMALLDDTQLNLTESNLLITNGETPLALAGIMGGKDSGIDKNTKTIILESANFDAVNIRHSRTKLNLKTESSDRFEKSIDPNLAEKAMVRIIEILEHTAGAKLEGIADVYPKPVKPWKIRLDLKYANNLLGEDVPLKNIVKILNFLGIRIRNGKTMECEIPTFRIDLRTPEDLIEEIGRIWGYEKVRENPLIEAVQPAKVNEQVFFERKMQDMLIGLGYDEVYNYSFYGEKDVQNCGLAETEHLELANPMNPDQKFVRTSLIPNILKNVQENLKYFEEFQIFEEGRVYLPQKSGMPREERRVVLAKVLEKDPSSVTFFSLKGDMEDILMTLGIKDPSFEEAEKILFWHPERSAEIKSYGKLIGRMGEINPQVLKKFKIKNRVVVAEIDTEVLKNIFPREKTFIPLNKFPSVFRDISMISKSGVKVAQILAVIERIGGNLVQNIELFDIFQKEGQSSYAFHIGFNAGNRTLERKEIEELMEKITDKLEKELKVEVRK